MKLCSCFNTSKNDYMAYETAIPGKQKNDAPMNYLIILILLLLSLNITQLAGCRPLNPWNTIIRCLFFSTIDKFCCIVFKNKWLLSLKRLAGLKIHRKPCIVKCNFNKLTSVRPGTFHPSIKEMFAILGLSSLSDNLTVFIF